MTELRNKAKDTYSTNPKTVKERERKAAMTGIQAILERVKGNNNLVISYHIDALIVIVKISLATVTLAFKNKSLQEYV